MIQEIDLRNRTENRTMNDRMDYFESKAEAVSDGLPGDHEVHIEGFDVTGSPANVVSDAAPAEKGNYVQRALSHVQAISPVLGLAADDTASTPEFIPDADYQETSSGAVAVHLHQAHDGVPVFQAEQTVRFAPDGALENVLNHAITVPEAGSVDDDLRVSPEEAVRRVAEYLADENNRDEETVDQFGQPLSAIEIDISDFEPDVIAAFLDIPQQPHVIERGPFGEPFKASLVWFPLGNELHLGWRVDATLSEYAGQYLAIVDAKDERILYCVQMSHMAVGELSKKATQVRGNVYGVDGGSERVMSEFDADWINRRNGTSGNNAIVTDENDKILKGERSKDVLTFDPIETDGSDQQRLNAFYLVNKLHDDAYDHGFTEAAGNFQWHNYGRGGFPSDRVRATCLPTAIQGTATMQTPVDGRSPLMRLGLVTSTNRHTAIDSSVVYHEYVHGITNRLVGGPRDSSALLAPQSRGMGEGWSDYVACTINESDVVGSWVVDRPNGIRKYRYDESFPDGFDKVGTDRYTGPHALGEIWCATLLQMNRNVGAKLGLRLVYDSLKLMPANPSMLDARDAIFTAFEDLVETGEVADPATARHGIRRAFAKFGMGPKARTNGPSLTGIVADYTLGDEDAVEDDTDADEPIVA